MPIDILFLGGTSIDLIQDKRYKKGQRKFIGGSITNSAVIAAKLGLKAAMLSRIGADPAGDFAVKSLVSCKVNTKGIIQDPAIRTHRAIANNDRSGNSTYTFYKNPPEQSNVPLKSVPRDLLKGLKIFHFGSSFSHQNPTSHEALKYVKYLKKKRVFISFDPNLRPYAVKDKKGVKNRVLGLLKWVDLAKLSETDLRFLTGQRNLEKGLRRLKKQFRCKVVVTLGSKGCAYLDQPPSLRGDQKTGALRSPLRPRSEASPLRPRSEASNLIKLPAFKVKVSDTIGAGDAFTAGLLYRIAKAGKMKVFSNIKPHLTFASAVSAIICAKPGASQALKGLGQVEKFLQYQN